MVPVRQLPDAVQAIGRFTLPYWALNALQSAMLDRAGVASPDIWPTLLLLLAATGMAGAAAAAALFRRFAAKGL